MKTYRKPIAIFDEQGNEIARYSSRNECAKALGVTPATLDYRIAKGNSYNGVICKHLIEENLVIPKSLTQSERKQKEIDYNKDYRLITYETKHKYVCVTPCPFKDKNIDVFVGSVKCEQYTSFRGKDREKHIVACKYNQWLKKNNK